jgi:hypothetical protein
LAERRKKGRPQSEKRMVHTGVLLPQSLLERLRRDAEASDGGLSAQIRQRLQLTYDLEGLPRDPETSDLVECIKSLANNLARDLGKKWHESRYALAAFKGGLATFLTPYAPEGDEGVRDIAGHSDNPETVGRTHARLIMAARGDEKKK